MQRLSLELLRNKICKVCYVTKYAPYLLTGMHL